MKARNEYHITQIPSLIFSFILTKIFFSNAKLIRFPADIRGKRFMTIGKNFVTGRYCRIDCVKINIEDDDPKLILGKNIQLNDKCHIACAGRIEIGDNVLIASNVFITDHDHINTKEEIDMSITWSKQPLHVDPVIIEENVWIGENVTILKGVTIGKNSIIGAGSVVTKSIPCNTINVGIPSKIINHLK